MEEVKMSGANDPDSDESDIFELVRIKPVSLLTKQRAIEIKNKVLASEDSPSEANGENVEKPSSNKAVNGEASPSWSRGEKRKGAFDYEKGHVSEDVIGEDGCNNCGKDVGSVSKTNREHGNTTPKKGATTSDQSPSKLITDYYTPTKTSPKACVKSPKATQSKSTENVQLSPGVRKRIKKFKTISIGNVSPNKQKTDKSVKEEQISDSVTVSEFFCSDFDDLSNVSNQKREPKLSENSYFYSQSLKRIIHHELKNQLLLEEKSVKEGKVFSKLFLKEDYECFEKFFQLPENACKLYARMLCRKKSWHRVSSINYSDINGKIEEVFSILNKSNFVDFDIVREGMDAQLDLLTKPEIQILCKSFKIKVINPNAKKQDFIDAILKSSKNQRSVIDLWKKNNESTRLMLLRSEIVRTLGPCVRLNESTLETFNRLLLLFSLTHDVMEEDMWSIQIRMMTEVHLGVVRYPNYVVTPTVIFEIRDDFISYQKAKELMWKFELAIESKNYTDFYAIAQKAKIKFSKALENEGFQQRYALLPSFLKRYNAGSVYARILSKYCEKFKKKKNSEEIIEITNTLLGQNLFLLGKKGQWYNNLIQAYEDLDRPEEAGSILLKALQDEGINEIDKLTIQLRGLAILKKKKKGLGKCQLRDELDDACVLGVTEPSKIEIKAKALDANEPGFKSIYVQESRQGRVYSSVEEHAIQYYKTNGFTDGIHSEGFIVQTLYLLIFFDITYGESPPGVFQSPYQEIPLDLYSKSFYSNRKDVIDLRLKELRSWSMDAIEDVITRVYAENCGVRCAITWKDHFDPKLFCDIVKCLGMSALASICERLVQSYGVFRSGFPDLTMWNSETGKLKFVEVKSPNDKLSPKQRIWLHFLRKLDIDCEVCNVKNIASRSLKNDM